MFDPSIFVLLAIGIVALAGLSRHSSKTTGLDKINGSSARSFGLDGRVNKTFFHPSAKTPIVKANGHLNIFC